MKRIIVRRSILPLVACIVLVSPALAADCGGGVPCSCGDVVAADHTLICGVDPVTVDPCSGDGLGVRAHVTLNLGGCTIRGADDGDGIVLGEGASVVAGRIIGFDTGVSRMSNSIPDTVRLLRISDTRRGIALNGGKLIERNVVERTEGIGILVESIGAIVRQNRIEDSGGCGLVVVDSHNVVDRNLVLRGGECGIRLSGLGHTVTRNQVKYTQAGPGFLFINAQLNHVSFNLSWGAEDPAGGGGSPGFLIRSVSEQNTFQRNVASHNDGFGIEDRTDLSPDTFNRNHCVGNALGKSSPPGLCQ